MLRWVPRFSLALALAIAVVGLVNRTAANSDKLCGASLGLYPTLEGQALSGHLDVLSWNIQKASNDGWARDLAELAGDVHLAFLQEAAVEAMIPDVIPGSPLYQAFTRGYTTGSLETGVMTLSSHSPSMLCNFTALEPWLGTPKAVTVTEHPLEGRDERLLAINIHAVNFTLGVEDFRRQLEPLAHLLGEHRGPAILAGDFNTWSEARQKLVDQLLSSQGLSALEFAEDRRTTAFGRPLDHIYVRGLRAERAEVVPVTSSDHNALRARLWLE